MLALVVSLVPLALDAYLPAFPLIGRDLGVSTSEVGLTLSIYVFALAIGQLVGGPLSDRYGRRPVIYAGLGVFVAGSLLIPTATTLPWMMACRAVQAFGGGWVAVNVPAIVRDRTSGSETARLMSLIGLMMFLAPALAPTIGTLIMSVAGWHGIFQLLAGYALIVGFLLEAFLFRGTRPAPPRRAAPLRSLVTNYRHVLGHGTAMLLIVLLGLSFSVLLMYLSNASFLLQEWLGVDDTGFSMVFAAVVCTMASISLLNRQLLRRFEPRQILGVALPCQGGAVVLLLGVTVMPVPHWLLIPCLMLIVGCMGAIGPNIQASVMQYFRELGGTAAAVMGATQFAVGGLLSGLSAVLVQGHAPRVGLAMLACSILANLLMFPAGRRLRHHPATD